MKEMKEIDFRAGCQIDDAYKDLQDYAKKYGPCFGMFNLAKLLSTDTLDECYKKVTGFTKEEFYRKEKERHEEYLRKEEEFKASIPQKIVEYRERARGIIPEEYLSSWDKIVPIRLNDLYHGMELDCWLELISELNKDIPTNEKFETCAQLFYKQGHSGMSAQLIFAGLKKFHTLGIGLVNYIKANI